MTAPVIAPSLLFIAALVGLAAVTLVRSRLASFATAVLLALIMAAAWWMWSTEQRASEVRIVVARALALEMQALTPGSIFPCLHVMGSEALKSACERALFQSPQTIAAAVEYTQAQLEVLLEGLQFDADKGVLKQPLDRIQRLLGQDQFGVAAYVLATRHGCTTNRCEPLSRLVTASAIQANLRQGTFQRHLDRFVSPVPMVAAQPPGSDLGPAVIDPRAVGGGIPATRFKPLGEQYSLPSATSIPPVSIMNDEPATTGGSAGAEKPPEQSAARAPIQPAARGAARQRPPPPQPMSLAPR